jgi:glycosyltransferase involved in cell wall biosynthesis
MIFFIGNETRRKPWLGVSKIKAYVKRNAIDVCHAHLAYGIVFSAFCGSPLIYTHHSIEPRWGRFVYGVFGVLVDKYVGISSACSTALQSYTGREVSTIVNSVDTDRFSQYVRRRTLSDQVVVAMVGRLALQKDYLNLLESLTLLPASVRDKLRVKVAGEGDSCYRRELVDYIKDNDLSDVVTFVGVERNIPGFLYEADIFLMSSAWEGLPISLIEATVSGMPCIVTDVGGCAEVVRACENGKVVPPKNPCALADQISAFFYDKSLMARLSDNAIKNSHKFSIGLAAEKHLDLYASVSRKGVRA